jgi:hypothetical protein
VRRLSHSQVANSLCSKALLELLLNGAALPFSLLLLSFLLLLLDERPKKIRFKQALRRGSCSGIPAEASGEEGAEVCVNLLWDVHHRRLPGVGKMEHESMHRREIPFFPRRLSCCHLQDGAAE